MSLISNLLSKLPLAFTPLLLLPYSLNSQALSAQTSSIIHGSVPYFTVDNGVTKLRTLDEFSDVFFSITLPDGTKLTPATNPSTETNPITLPSAVNTFADVRTLITAITPPQSEGVYKVTLNDLVNTYHYWGDDDGDGQGGQVTATGYLKAVFFNKYGNLVNPSDALTHCLAPYRLNLYSSRSISLTTQYGVPNTLNVGQNDVEYYFNPAPSPTLCHAKPTRADASWASPHWDSFAGESGGYFIQSTNPASYGLNFPTTGMDGFAFDLDIKGVDASQLTWQPVTHSGITATVSWTKTSSDDKYPSGTRPEYITRVTLTGPKLSRDQERNPSPLSKPTLPQTFELVGRDSAGNALITYGFELKQWFVGKDSQLIFTVSEATTLCNALGYRLPKVKDLTIATLSDRSSKREIGAGLITEWAEKLNYGGGIVFTSDVSDNRPVLVMSGPSPRLSLLARPDWMEHVVCVTP